LGNQLLPVTISDAQARTASTTIALVVQQPHVVISQIYGGGGNASASYTNDFVELYNPTGVTFDLSDYSLQYASADGDGWEFTRTPLGGTIAPGEYYLIALGSGGAVGSPLPAANITSDVNISGSAGKLALVNSFEPLIGNCPLGDATIQDFVGYGATADCFETAKAPAPTDSTSALYRANGGATDSDNNAADFANASANPRRTAPIVEIGPSVFGTTRGGTDSMLHAMRA
jgi:predicted extracellular nuclease